MRNGNRNRMRKKHNRNKIMAVIIVTVYFMYMILPTYAMHSGEEQDISVTTEYVAVTELDMGDYTETMTVGEKQLLSVTVLPIDATDTKITYNSANPAVATVNGMGRITAVAEGSVVITASCGGKSGTVALTVKKAEKATTEAVVTELDMGEYSKEMTVGESQLLSVTPLPTSITEAVITYTSSNSNVATVNTMGRINARSVGKTKITASCNGKTASFRLNVKEKETTEVAVTDIEISDYEEKLEVDKTLNLTATVVPSDATDSKVSFRSSDPSVATVNSSGEVKGIAKGKVTIYAKAGKIKKKIPITVIVATTTIEINNNYLILKPGETVTLTANVKPKEAEQKVTYRAVDTTIANVSGAGVVTAKAAGATSIIVSNGDTSISVSVIVNQSTSTKEEKEKDSTKKPETKEYDKEINASETTCIDSDNLYNLYKEKETLKIQGEGYIMELDGKDIVNYNNELYTDIALSHDEEGIHFQLNQGQALCGDITLYLSSGQEGKYLYLYNQAKKRYDLIQAEDLSALRLTTAGEYMITVEKRKELPGMVKYILIIGGCVGVIGVGVYIGIKKKYWFW